MLERLKIKLRMMISGERKIKVIVILGMAGLGCIFLSSLIPEKDVSESVKSDIISQAFDDGTEYASALEERLEAILSRIEGVGECRVMITVSGSMANTYAADSREYADSESYETDREYVLFNDKEGDSPLIEYTINPQIKGVIIACEGGEHNVVREMVYEAAGAVLNIPSNRICVVKITEER